MLLKLLVAQKMASVNRSLNRVSLYSHFTSSKTLYIGTVQSQIQFIVPVNIGETIIKDSIKTPKLEKQ